MPSPSSIHFFITQNGFSSQLANKAFGPKDENNFRLTSSFTADGSTKAYSICKGVVLVQPQSGSGNSNKVNLILRPFKQPFPGLNIKYFIYRGLKKEDFFTGNNIKVTNPDNLTLTSDFINKINKDFKDFYDNAPAGTVRPDFVSNFIGYDPNVSDDKLISDFFFKESQFVEAGGTFDETDEFELPMIDIGKSLGNFASGECGIDVVLNYGDYKHNFNNSEFVFDLEYARKSEATIELAGTDYEKKLLREQSTQFIDVAAFYGLFVKEGKITVADSSGAKSDISGAAIYNSVINNFATKNSWYIYIQGDRTRSYDFYDNYKIAESSANNMKYGLLESSMAEASYGTYKWPVIVDTQTQSSSTTNNLYLQLVTDNNVNTVLYGQIGTIDNAQQNNFCNAEDLRLPLDTEGNYGRLTKVIKLNTPSVESTGTIASISLLIYQGITYEYEVATVLDGNEQPVTVMGKPNFFDDVFDLINSEPLLKLTEGIEFSKMTSEKLKLINLYYNKQQQGVNAVQSLTVNDIIDTGIQAEPTLRRVTYVTETADVMNNVVSPTGSITPDTKTSASMGGTIAKSKTFQLSDPYYYKLKLFTDGTQTINGLELKVSDDSTPNKILLGLTKSENDSIIALIPNEGSFKNPRVFLVDLFEDNSELISPENITYQKYKLGIVVEDISILGKAKLILPTTNIIVYSLDRKFNFSKGYSEYIVEENSQIKGDNLLSDQIVF